LHTGAIFMLRIASRQDVLHNVFPFSRIQKLDDPAMRDTSLSSSADRLRSAPKGLAIRPCWFDCTLDPQACLQPTKTKRQLARQTFHVATVLMRIRISRIAEGIENLEINGIKENARGVLNIYCFVGFYPCSGHTVLRICSNSSLYFPPVSLRTRS
jgi:hypothetical protein